MRTFVVVAWPGNFIGFFVVPLTIEIAVALFLLYYNKALVSSVRKSYRYYSLVRVLNKLTLSGPVYSYESSNNNRQRRAPAVPMDFCFFFFKSWHTGARAVTNQAPPNERAREKTRFSRCKRRPSRISVGLVGKKI